VGEDRKVLLIRRFAEEGWWFPLRDRSGIEFFIRGDEGLFVLARKGARSYCRVAADVAGLFFLSGGVGVLPGNSRGM